MIANLALNLAPFSRWTLRDKAAERRLALCWASHAPVIPPKTFYTHDQQEAFMIKFAQIIALAFGAITWFAIRNGGLPMPDDNSPPFSPHGFSYNMAFSGYLFGAYILGYCLIVLPKWSIIFKPLLSGSLASDQLADSAVATLRECGYRVDLEGGKWIVTDPDGAITRSFSTSADLASQVGFLVQRIKGAKVN